MITLNLPDYCQNCPYANFQTICESAGNNYFYSTVVCKNANICERIYNLLKKNQQMLKEQIEEAT